mgnify:CR=1 FL=1
MTDRTPDMTDTPQARELVIWRCDVTGNPVGTDTRPIGAPCQCQGCRAASLLAKQSDEIARLTSERDDVLKSCSHNWTLFNDELERRKEAESELTRLREQVGKAREV